MPTCQFPNCTSDTPSKRHKYCQLHKEEVAKAVMKKHNASNSVKKSIKLKSAVHHCRYEGCETVVANGSIHYCPDHRKVMLREWKRKAAERVAERGAIYDRPINEPWEPKPKAPPIITDEDQRKIDAEILMRERLRCGTTHSPVRSLSREEIEQLQHQYQPAKFVRDEVILPWSKRIAAEPKGNSLRRP